MKYLPTENILYKTKLNEARVIERLLDNIEPEKAIRFGLFSKRPTKPYQGKLVGRTFNISRIINYRNSFLPRISGDIETTGNGTLVKVQMRLHIAVIVFLSVWLGIVLFACASIFFQSFSSTDFNPLSLIPFGMLLFFYVVVMLAFKYESRESKRFLQTLFEAEILEEQ